jgi:hypothetical protein
MKKYLILLLLLVAASAFADAQQTSETTQAAETAQTAETLQQTEAEQPAEAVQTPDQAGVIASFEGRVTLFDGVSPRGTQVETPDTPIFLKNRIATKSSSTAVISMLAEDKIALTENSMMTIEDINTYKPEGGKVVFSIKTRGQASGLNIALTSAVIGVKGTEFLIDTNEDGRQDCYMKEGVVEVTPLHGQFKKYMEVKVDEYEAYVRKMMGDYDQYVKKLQEEYVEYVDKLVIKAGNAWSITGNEVHKLEFTPEIEDAFKLLDKETNQ